MTPPPSMPSRTAPRPPTPTAPRQRWLAGGRDVATAFETLAAQAAREICCADTDLAVFAPAGSTAVAHLHRLLLADPRAQVLLLVDDTTWLDRAAPRLRLLQRQFAHALKLRHAPADDPVGSERMLVVDATHAVELRQTRHGVGEQWLWHPGKAGPMRAAFERRWQAAAHDLPVQPLGL